MSEYQEQALRFLADSGATMTIEPDGTVFGFPNDNDGLYRNKYKVTISRNGNSYTFPFYDSHHDYVHHIDPTEYDVLACLTKYDVGSMADFVGEYGYKIVDRESFLRIENIWKSCKDEYQSLLKLFGEELLDKLREIN